MMEGRDGIFDDYMGVQYREGQRAYEDGVPKRQCPYSRDCEAGKAWIDGWEYGHFMNKGH